MKFDIFCESQRAKPFGKDHERSLILDTIDEARAAERAGFSTWWQVEHHGTPEFSHSSAPELLLTAIALKTRTLRVGHAGVLAPFRINPPWRVAERAAWLDILSDGRFEMGLTKSGGKEFDTFGANPATARDELREALTMIPQMWCNEKFSWNSPLFQMPERELIPKPLQKPHPRLWQTASSPEAFRMAGELGVGVLSSVLFGPLDFLKNMLAEYDKGASASGKTVGRFMNRQKGIFGFVHVAETRQKAIESGAALSSLWYVHTAPTAFQVPRKVVWDIIRQGLNPQLARNQAHTSTALSGDPTDLNDDPNEIPLIALLKRMARGEKVSFEEAHEAVEPLDSVIIGDPDHCFGKMKKFQGIGTDRMMCLMQFGHLAHEAILHSIRLTGEHIIPKFTDGEAALSGNVAAAAD
jgi:alkanesulfonate monooxygenase SsuD/methylene tetrahydromethanopterin reductase-like flavin-dependent oxidoreductase (luciferase family)